MFYLKHVHPSHSSGEYVLVQMIQVSTPFFRWNQLRIDLVSCYMLHVTCYMWSVMCCMWLVTCKSFIIYWETGDQELCSWFFCLDVKTWLDLTWTAHLDHHPHTSPMAPNEVVCSYFYLVMLWPCHATATGYHNATLSLIMVLLGKCVMLLLLLLSDYSQ